MATFQKIVAMADAAGMVAGQAATPEPMVVYEAAGITGDAPKPGGQSWYVPEGVCGFAWVRFAGNTEFGRWAKRHGIASKGYPSGLEVWVGAFNQSYDRKMAFANSLSPNILSCCSSIP